MHVIHVAMRLAPVTKVVLRPLQAVLGARAPERPLFPTHAWVSVWAERGKTNTYSWDGRTRFKSSFTSSVTSGK